MELREFPLTIVLYGIMLISTYVALFTLTRNLTLLISGLFVMGSIGGMIVICVSLLHSIRESSLVRERMLQFSLEEMSEKMVHEYNETTRRFDAIMDDLTRRTYR